MTAPYHIVINARSGGAQGMTPHDLTALLHEALPGRVESITYATGDRLDEIIRSRINDNPLPILVGGGDGSLASAAAVTTAHGLPLGVLPLGTMNLLAHDLGLGDRLDMLLPRYGDARIAMIDAGKVAGRLFLCSAVIGIVPETGLKREEARQSHSLTDWAGFSGLLARGLSGQTPQKLTLACDGETFDVEVSALVISNNIFLPPGAKADRYRRASLTGGKLGVYGIRPQGALDGLRLLFKLWNGSWHEDETVFSFETESLTVTAAAPALLVSIDGEPATLPAPLVFSIAPESVPILLPAAAA